MTPAQLLELVPPSSEAVEKQIAADVKIIGFAVKGTFAARNLFFAYAAIAGARANHIMEIAAHGEGEKILAQHFPDISENTLKNWRQFAKTLEPALSKRPTVGLLTSPGLAKKRIPKKIAAEIQQAVVETMDGKGMMEFMRASKALGEAKPIGGNNGADNTGPRKPNAEQQTENANRTAEEWGWQLQTMQDAEQDRKLMHTSKLNALILKLQETARVYTDEQKERKKK